jgi:hypothetical protein
VIIFGAGAGGVAGAAAAAAGGVAGAGAGACPSIVTAKDANIRANVVRVFMRYFLQMAFFAAARLITPMIPTRLTTIPIKTITIRPDVLDDMPRLATLIRKPRKVITSPANIIP